MPIDAAYRDKIGMLLTDRLISALKNNEISEEEMPNVTSFILGGIDAVQTQEQMLTFLQDLNTKWPIFSSVVTVEKGESIEKRDEEKVEQMEELIKENKLDEALRVVEAPKAMKGDN